MECLPFAGGVGAPREATGARSPSGRVTSPLTRCTGDQLLVVPCRVSTADIGTGLNISTPGAEYDWGADPVQWLATTSDVRRVILDRFGTGQLKPGEWVYDLQRRFNLAYLYHRFGIQAAQQFVGGQFQTNAVAGDGQTPVAWVPDEKQRQALDLLLSAIEPQNLDIPDRILATLVPAPSGTRETVERFASEAGDTFSL